MRDRVEEYWSKKKMAVPGTENRRLKKGRERKKKKIEKKTWSG